MNITILNKHTFDSTLTQNKINDINVEEYKGVCFISINDSCGTFELPYFKNNH